MHNPKWSQIRNWPYRILISAGYGSEKTKTKKCFIKFNTLPNSHW